MWPRIAHGLGDQWAIEMPDRIDDGRLSPPGTSAARSADLKPGEF